MNEVTQQLTKCMIPQCAIIAYGDVNQEKIQYIELRNIVNGEMAAGTPLTHKALADMMKILNIDEQSSLPYGAMPPNMLYCDSRPGKSRYVWYNPPQKRMMYFKEELNIKDGIYHVPGVIYKAEASSLSIYAFKGNEVPNMESEIYQAPFFNVYAGGDICLGNAKVKKPNENTYANLIMYWEKMFWGSISTNIFSNPVKGNLVLVTKQSASHFDEEVLLPLKQGKKVKTLKDILK